MTKTKSFSWRAFAALGMALTGLGLPLTGYANHALGLEPLTVARHAWMAAHNVMSVAFTAFALWHMVLHRRALGRHLGVVWGRLPTIRREALATVGLTLALLALAVGHALVMG